MYADYKPEVIRVENILIDNAKVMAKAKSCSVAAPNISIATTGIKVESDVLIVRMNT